MQHRHGIACKKHLNCRQMLATQKVGDPWHNLAQGAKLIEALSLVLKQQHKRIAGSTTGWLCPPSITLPPAVPFCR